MTIITETKLLKPVAQATVPARTKPFNAAEFYQDRTGLCVNTSFIKCFELKSRTAVVSAPERPYVAYALKDYAYDVDIRQELPETHLSTLEDIAGLIDAQPGGELGVLLNNGDANIFYVEGQDGVVFAVNVHWESDSGCGSEWFVNEWTLGERGEWPADDQVFCPGNAAL